MLPHHRKLMAASLLPLAFLVLSISSVESALAQAPAQESPQQQFDNTRMEAIRLSPKEPRFYHYRGLLYNDKDEPDLAIKDTTTAIGLDPNYPASYYTRANALFAKGDFEGAIRDLTQYIRLLPNDAAGYEARARTYRKTGKDDLAKADEQKVLALKGKR